MKKYTVKLVLSKHLKNKFGHHPIYVRVTIDRKTSYTSTGYYIPIKMWDEKNEQVKDGHPMASIINPDITTKKALYLRSIVDTQIKGEALSAAHLKEKLTSKVDFQNIFDFIDQFTKDVRNKRKAGTIENYRKHSKRLEIFYGSRKLNFQDITPAFLQRYDDHLRKEVGANYTHTLFKTMKTFFNAAIKRGLISNYPFSEYENPVYSAPVKDYLNLDELKKIESYADDTENWMHKQASVYFLLGCYSGLRVSDWIAFDAKTHISDGRLKLYAKKNGELVTMPISRPLERNLQRIEGFPLRIKEDALNQQLKGVAKKLGINKRLTTHTGRHTFAITICAEQGISSEVCAMLMGIKVKTCLENYYKTSRIKIDTEVSSIWDKLK